MSTVGEPLLLTESKKKLLLCKLEKRIDRMMMGSPTTDGLLTKPQHDEQI